MPTFTHGHALVIGVGADLPTTVDDAEGLARILRDPDRCAYPANQVQVLTGPQATRPQVLAALDKLSHATNPDTTVIVYAKGWERERRERVGTRNSRKCAKAAKCILCILRGLRGLRGE